MQTLHASCMHDLFVCTMKLSHLSLYCLCLGAFVWLCIYFGLPEEGMAGAAACIGVWEDDRSEFARGRPSISSVPHQQSCQTHAWTIDTRCINNGIVSALYITMCWSLIFIRRNTFLYNLT